MAARGRCLEKNKCMPYIVTKHCVQQLRCFSAATQDQRYKDIGRGNKEDKRQNRSRVDRNKRSDITRDKTRKTVLKKLRSKRNKKRQAPKITAEVGKKRLDAGGGKTCVSSQSQSRRRRWVGFCRASKIAAVYLTRPTEIPFHLVSRIYRAAFSPYSPQAIAVSHSFPFSAPPRSRPSSTAFSR